MSIAAPVGVVTSSSTLPEVNTKGLPLKICNTALLGLGTVPCENFTVPPPTATFVDNILKPNKLRSCNAVAQPTRSTNVSMLEVSCKFKLVILLPCTSASAKSIDLKDSSANDLAVESRFRESQQDANDLYISIPFLIPLFSSY